MKKIGITLLIMVCYCSIVVSQDSIRIETTIDLDIKSKHILPSIDTDIFIPEVATF